MKSSATGGSDIWDRNRYLNVWICDISDGASAGTAGYAYRPTPTAPTISASGPTTFCDGGSVDLTSSYSTGNTWSGADAQSCREIPAWVWNSL